LCRNSIAFVRAFFAVSAAGGVSILLDRSLSDDELSGQINDCSASIIFAGTSFNERAQKLSLRVPSVKAVINEKEDCKDKIAELKVSPVSPATIIYTSASTGRPLGVTLSHKNLISNSRAIAGYTRISSSSRISCVLPLHYVYGLSLLLSHLISGASVVLDNNFAYPARVIENLIKYRVTEFAGVSSHYAILLQKADFGKTKLPYLKSFLQAGDSMPVYLTRELVKCFPEKKIYLMYGQTEASPRITYLDPELVSRKPDSVGKAITGVKVKIVNSRGRECPVGKEGEVVVKGKNVMLGYWGKKKGGSGVIKDGWLYTGASWKFVLWGVYHAVLLIIYSKIKPYLRLIKSTSPSASRTIKALSVFAVFNLFAFGIIFFAAASTEQVITVVRNTFTGLFSPGYFNQYTLMLVFALIAPVMLMEFFQHKKDDEMVCLKWPLAVRGLVYYAMLYAIILYGDFSAKIYYYFQF